MSEDKKSLIDLVPDSVDNAVKNITDKPTQNMGNTFADIWYLVFGGISQAAEKRKLKYSYALQEFEKELKEKISKIPEKNKIEPDIQVIAPALEASKYCVEKETLRSMFSKLISSSMNVDKQKYSHPIFTDIIKSMSEFDAKVFIMLLTDKNFYHTDSKLFSADVSELSFSFAALEKLGLIQYIDTENRKNSNISPIDLSLYIVEHDLDKASYHNGKFNYIQITQIGIIFAHACVLDE